MAGKEAKEESGKAQARSAGYDAVGAESEVLNLWKKERIYDKIVKRNKGKRSFFYLDGPPYTTGSIHIGHAWGKALRDSIMRYKRMQGFDVRDQPGFDMHGLPIENQVEKELGLKNKQEIVDKFGVEKFTKECESYALRMMKPMIKDFERLGVWMDWKDPYMTIKNEYIEGAWHTLSLAEKNGYLYEGKKAMTWCPQCATALAKHELEYADRTDDSIFVKLPIRDRENEFLVVWTTTPWTLPFNLAVMVNPDFDYVRAKIRENGEVWIVVKELAIQVINNSAEKTFDIIEELKGERLSGIRYFHPFLDEDSEQRHIFDDNPKSHSVVFGPEFVTLDAGSGLVHCAPGCGPEDFEVGRRNNLPAYNSVDDYGEFPEGMGRLSGLFAKKDDSRFIEILEEKGLIVSKSKIRHEYAHCWRSKTPVIFRATDQWFLAVERLKKEMIKENEGIAWTPDWGGNRWFKSWLENLQDWCISRQRFWGIPLPIWKCECGKIKVIGSKKEAEELSGKKIENLHRPFIDGIRIKCDCRKDMHRVPDILDVWFDSGAAPWASLEYPGKNTYEILGTPDLILEGKDQIRGWFNSLTCMSMVSFRKIPFKAVYMHGFVNDALGRKFSKSLKNGISPYEVIDKHGADVLRYYMIGAAAPGLDINYNAEDMLQKAKNLQILWNLHKFLIEYSKTIGKKPHKLKIDEKALDIPERYIISKMNSALKRMTDSFDGYRLNETPWIAEELYLALSRTYIQNVREKSSVGTDEEKEIVLYTIYRVLYETIKMLAPIAPFMTETMYQNLKKEFKLDEESVHLLSWPNFYEEEIDGELERDSENVEKVITAILSAREKAQIGVRWPISSVRIVSRDKGVREAASRMKEIIKVQTNTKEIEVLENFREAKVAAKPDFAKIAPVYKDFTPKIIAKLVFESPESILKHIEEKGRFEMKIEGRDIVLEKQHLIIERTVPPDTVFAEFSGGEIYLSAERTPRLEGEGYAREIMRRVQQLRKDAGLKKTHEISLAISFDDALFDELAKHEGLIAEKCGARKISVEKDIPGKKHEHAREEKIKGKSVWIGFDVLK